MKRTKHRPEQIIKKLREADAMLAADKTIGQVCQALEVDRGLTADRVLDVLTNLFLTRGVPRHIRSDNGPEFIATAIRRHAEQAGLEMLYIEPGSPWENGFAESFFSRLRDELLNCEEFANLAEDHEAFLDVGAGAQPSVYCRSAPAPNRLGLFRRRPVPWRRIGLLRAVQNGGGGRSKVVALVSEELRWVGAMCCE
jgi:transposase InsO family protein